MGDSYSRKEAIKIIKRALTGNDQHITQDDIYETLEYKEIENIAEEFDISKTELQKAVTEVTQTKEHKRDELYPEMVAARWIYGRVGKHDIDSFFSELKLEFGRSRQQWTGMPTEVHKIGNMWEYKLKDATILLTDKWDGYQLQVIKQQFFHGNNIEASILAIPVASILGLLPVAGTAE